MTQNERSFLHSETGSENPMKVEKKLTVNFVTVNSELTNLILTNTSKQLNTLTLKRLELTNKDPFLWLFQKQLAFQQNKGENVKS